MKYLNVEIIHTKENYLSLFWMWIELLSNNNYQLAVDSLYWENSAWFTASELEKRVTTFFGGEHPWHVIIPNQRLIGVINDNADVMPPKKAIMDG